MRFAYDMYFGAELHDVQLALYYLACKAGVDEEGKPLGFQPRFLSLWYPKDGVWGGMRQDIFSVGRPAGLKEYREKPLTTEDLERSRAVVMNAIERIKAGHFEPAPRELPGTCVTRFGSCPHAAICSYGGVPPRPSPFWPVGPPRAPGVSEPPPPCRCGCSFCWPARW